MRSQRTLETRRAVWSTTLGVCYLQGQQGCTAGVLFECVRTPDLIDWNNLPQTLRHSDSTSSFKAALKTHLFNNYF